MEGYLNIKNLAKNDKSLHGANRSCIMKVQFNSRRRGRMSTIDQQFVEYVVKALVGHPDDVAVEREIDEKGVLLTLTVNPEDLGRVIGKRGGTAQSLRTLLP